MGVFACYGDKWTVRWTAALLPPHQLLEDVLQQNPRKRPQILTIAPSPFLPLKYLAASTKSPKKQDCCKTRAPAALMVDHLQVPVEDDDLENLELQVKEIAQSVLHYRKTLPDQFKKSVSSFLVAQRPSINLPNLSSSVSPSQTDVPGVSGNRNPGLEGNLDSSEEPLLTEEDPETAEKIRALKLRISNSISALPNALERMKDCIAMIDELETYNTSIDPTFKRKRT